MSIEAMKQALEALVRADRISGHPNNGKTITALRAAIAEASMQRLTDVQQAMEQEPVAWFHEEKYKTHFTTNPSEDMIGKYWQPLYTVPRQWVGLTNEEIEAVMQGSVEGERMLPYQFARAIEAKLKGKA